MFVLTEVSPRPGVWTFEIQVKDAPSSTVFEIHIIHVRVSATVDINPDTLNLKSKDKWVTGYIELPPGWGVEHVEGDP